MPGNLANYESTLRRLGGDQVLFRDLVGFFFEDYPGLLLQIKQALFNRDAEAVERAAHRLKGLICNFDTSLSNSSAMIIEQMGRTHDLAGAETEFPAFQEGLERLANSLKPYWNPERTKSS